MGNIICLVMGFLVLISLGCSSAREDKEVGAVSQEQKAKAPQDSTTKPITTGSPSLPAPLPTTAKFDYTAPGSILAPRRAAMVEEIWIVEKQREWVAADYYPGSGQLLIQRGTERISIAATDMSIQASILGFASLVEVGQRFHNPYRQNVQAVYFFPLPSNAAITDFILTIGQRHIRGMIRERQEAREIYAAAQKQGYRAALLSRDNGKLFGQRLANIAPGKDIEVKITYFYQLPYHDGAFQFVLPLKTNPSRQGYGQSTRSANVIRSLKVDIETGVDLADIYCRHHPITIARPSASRAIVTLGHTQQPIAHDFVLSYRLVDQAQAVLVTQQNRHSATTFALIVQQGPHPLVHPTIVWGNWRISALHPEILPKMVKNRPVMICGCLVAAGNDPPHLIGIVNGNKRLTIPVGLLDGYYLAIDKLWAQRRIHHLTRQNRQGPTHKLKTRQAIDLSLRYGLLCDDTAFIVVDSFAAEK